MSNNSSNSGVSLLGYYAAVALLVINVQSLIFPVLAGYGGQWARFRGGDIFGWGDLAFYPQTKLYPLDICLYIATVLVIIWVARKHFNNKNFAALPKMYIYLSMVPFAWAIVSFVIGFNYEKCNTPSQFKSCENPSAILTQKLILHAVIVGLTLIAMKLISKKLSSSKNPS